MLKLKEHKESTQDLAIKDAPLPQQSFIPLSQHLGRPADILEVKIGDAVKTGQLLARSDAPVSSSVHASICGKVSAIKNCLHPVLGWAKAIVIDRDKEIEEPQFSAKHEAEIGNLSIDALRKIIKDAGIVGMGGAAFPTYIKLSPPNLVDSLIINGAECEPYLTSDARLMIEETEGIISGINIIAKILKVKDVYIAIEDNKPEAIKQFRVQGSGFRVKVLKTRYPQGAEKQLIYSVIKRKVPSGKLPFDIGAVAQNVATCFAVYEAVYKEKPLFERVVTITGDILENPGNFRVRIGTPIKDLISSCGPLKKDPNSSTPLTIGKIIIGGPMMGLAQFSDEVPVIKGTGGVLILADDEARQVEEEVCLRCGECIKNCPMGLSAAMIVAAASKGQWGLAKEYGALDCIECGLCAYNCPANKNVVQWIKQVKATIK